MTVQTRGGWDAGRAEGDFAAKHVVRRCLGKENLEVHVGSGGGEPGWEASELPPVSGLHPAKTQ